MHKKATLPACTLLPHTEQGPWTGPGWRTEKVEEAHRELKWALLLGVGKRTEETGEGEAEELRSEAHERVRGSGTGSEGRWHSTSLGRHQGEKVSCDG